MAINLINLVCIFFILIFLFRLIGVVFSKGTMLSVSDKYDPVNNKRTNEINKSMKLHILWVYKITTKFIMQLANYKQRIIIRRRLSG